MNLRDLLEAIPSTEPATFNELCKALGEDCPDKGDKGAWRELFVALEDAETERLIDVERLHNKIDTLMLTDEGVQRLRELRK